MLEHSLIMPIAEGIRVAENAERLLTYGEVVELRFVECVRQTTSPLPPHIA